MKIDNQTAVSEVLLNCENNLKKLRKLYVEDLDNSNEPDEMSQILNGFIKDNIDRIDTALKQIKKIK
jgi:hypothetical protein